MQSLQRHISTVNPVFKIVDGKDVIFHGGKCCHCSCAQVNMCESVRCIRASTMHVELIFFHVVSFYFCVLFFLFFVMFILM